MESLSCIMRAPFSLRRCTKGPFGTKVMLSRIHPGSRRPHQSPAKAAAQFDTAKAHCDREPPSDLSAAPASIEAWALPRSEERRDSPGD
jgi:hypothetical protein